MTPRRSTLLAFTLTELLVVVTVMSMLSALTLSVTGRVRSAGEAAVCTTHLRHLAAANLAFAADHDGQFCPAQDFRNLVRWHGARPSESEPFDPAGGFLSPYLGNDGRVGRCPTLRRVTCGAGSFETGAGGYGYNATYVGGTPDSQFSAARAGSITHPGRTVMFADTAFPVGDGLQEYPYAEPFRHAGPGGKLYQPADPSVHFRHNGRAHVAWCDGRVTTESASRLGGQNTYGGNGEASRIGWLGPEPNNGYWNSRQE